MKKSISLLFVLMVSMSGLSACNTVEGFGKDMSKLGEKIQQSGK